MLRTCCWIATTLRRRLASSHSPRQTPRRTPPTRLVLEPLEDRAVPAAVTVSNLNDLVNGTTTNITALIANDGGDGISLREAILASNNPDEDDTINFQNGLTGTLPLTGGQMAITDPVTITGNGAANTIIDAQQMSRIFDMSTAAGDVTLDGLTLLNGRTTANMDRGGAIRFESNGTLTIRNSILSGNSTTGSLAMGGAIGSSSGVVTVSHSTLSGNFTTGSSSSGGAIFVGNRPLTVSHSTLSGNSTAATQSNGGALAVGTGGTVTVSNSTLSNNSTAGTLSSGGAISSHNFAITVTNSTVVFNRATIATAGGIFSTSGGVTVHNSIVAKNTDNGTAPDLNTGGALTVRNSLIGINTGSGLTAAPLPTPDANGNFIGGAGAAAIDPLLGLLANNDGPTQTHALLAGSPAINRGDNILALDPQNNPLVHDQRGAGFARFVGLVDMGAFEIQPSPPPPPPPPSPPGPSGSSLPVVTIQVKKAKRVTRVIVHKDGVVHKTLYPFGKRFTGKVKVLQGDFNGDGLLDVRAIATVNGKKKTRTFFTS